MWFALPSAADFNLRWPKTADVELRSEASVSSKTLYRLVPEYPVILREQKDEWCYVAVFSDTSKTGVVYCNQLASERLSDVQLFWLSPSIGKFKHIGQQLYNQLTQEQQQQQFDAYYQFVEEFNASYDALSDEQKQRVEQGSPELILNLPANPEFDEMKKLLAKGIKVHSDLLWRYQTPVKLVSDDPNVLNGVDHEIVDILLALIHRDILPKIKPSFFNSANEVLFVGSDADIDDLSVVADSSMKAVVSKPAYIKEFHEPTYVGYWDAGELNIRFDKPLSVYSIARNGLVGKSVGQNFSDGGAGGYCDGAMTKLLPDDFTSITGYPETQDPIVQIYSRKKIPPKINVSTQTQSIRKLLPEKENDKDMYLHQIDINKDGLTDILVVEGELPSFMYEGDFKFWSMYFINIQGEWYYASSFVTPECT